MRREAMTASLQTRMGILLLAFFGLLSISVAATFWAIDTQKQDALIINLAGRQRMLVQQMTRDVLNIKHDGAEASVQSLVEAAHTFERTLTALVLGGTTTYPPGRTVAIPAVQDAETLTALRQVQATWATFRGHLNRIVAAPPASPERLTAIQAVENLAPILIWQADEVVRRYEAAARHKLARLGRIQIAFLAGALLLLVLDFLLLHKLIVRPLRELGSTAERIGGGDFGPIELTGPREIKRLAHSFNQMQAQLQAWTEELETRVEQRTAELAALHEASREIALQLEINKERQRIAAEMHDGLAQMLSYLGLQVEQIVDLVEADRAEEVIGRLQRLYKAIEQASQDVRRSIIRLQESPQPRRALQDQLAAIVKEFSRQGGPPVTLSLGTIPSLFLSRDQCEQVTRVVQEALLNARRHAQAGRVIVRLERQGTEATVTITDDGRGFDPDAPHDDGRPRFGLSVMRARAARLDGRLDIRSSPGRGTQITLTWPLTPNTC